MFVPTVPTVPVKNGAWNGRWNGILLCQNACKLLIIIIILLRSEEHTSELQSH